MTQQVVGWARVHWHTVRAHAVADGLIGRAGLPDNLLSLPCDRLVWYVESLLVRFDQTADALDKAYRDHARAVRRVALAGSATGADSRIARNDQIAQFVRRFGG